MSDGDIPGSRVAGSARPSARVGVCRTSDEKRVSRLDHLESANSLNSSPQLTVRRACRHKTTTARHDRTATATASTRARHAHPRARPRAFVAAVAASRADPPLAAPAPTTPRNPAALREAVPSSLPRPTRAIFKPPLAPSLRSALTATARALPAARPLRALPTPSAFRSARPRRTTPRTFPVGTKPGPTPLASPPPPSPLGFDGDFLYGFRSVVAVYPSALDRDDAPRHPPSSPGVPARTTRAGTSTTSRS